MRNLPFKHNSFDAVYASFSIHFFKAAEIKEIIKKIHRIVKPNGFFFLIAKNVKDKYYGKGTEIEPNTFIRENIMRHFFTEKEVKQLLSDFKIIRCIEDSHTKKYDPLSFYYKVTARKVKL